MNLGITLTLLLMFCEFAGFWSNLSDFLIASLLGTLKYDLFNINLDKYYYHNFPSLNNEFGFYRYVFARPAGKRCFVVSSNGTTVSRLRNGSLLHRFPSSLPNGSKSRDASRSAQSYCILDCIFHEVRHISSLYA